MKPKVTYHAEANAAYIRLSQTDVLESEEVTPGVVFDFGAEGHIVGIELLNARGQLTRTCWLRPPDQSAELKNSIVAPVMPPSSVPKLRLMEKCE
jgi:uncharacterized protein YuzE